MRAAHARPLRDGYPESFFRWRRMMDEHDLLGHDVETADSGAATIATTVRDGLAIVSLQGEFDVYAAPALRSCLLQQVERGLSCVVDLRGVGFVDSSALSALVAAKREATLRGLTVVLVLEPDRRPVRSAIAHAQLRFTEAATIEAALNIALRRKAASGA
jgi:anti-sigma B factor antagonist